MTLKYLGFSNNSNGGSFCMRITNIAGGRPDDASLRDSLPYRSPRQPCRLPRHCQVIVTVTVVVIGSSLSGYYHCFCQILPLLFLLPLSLSLSRPVHTNHSFQCVMHCH